MAMNGGPTGSSSFTNSTNGVDYAAKYAKQIDERFSLASVVAPATNNDFDFNGVNAITVFSVDTVDLVTYTRSGSNRFGAPKELSNASQTMTITQDYAFTFTIDNRSKLATGGAMDAGAALDRQLREKCVPMYDRYVLQTLYNVANGYNPTSNVGQNVVTPAAAVTKDNAFSEFLNAQNVMGNARVPLENRTAFVSYEFYSYLKQGQFVLDSEEGMKIHHSGVVGTVDGTKLIPVPSDLLPANQNVLAIVIASNLVIAPRPITYYNVHNNPPGIHGWLVEGRMLYDCFVLNNRRDAIYVLKQKTS